ncbi:lymphocyte antigen 6G-like [Archocentrus centrarchus]|uniref:UPAR/Ly6 domain-containing protein n=1 Tax=Amphilophus citrinellus TaxID=61819 RepID=A0A3Q0RC39_AMPCI|nr:lymphocyte antigen 6G-like [Archocentrus centrarchus]
MKPLGAMIVFLTLSTACGLRCYSCLASDPRSCTQTTTCSDPLDRCYTFYVSGTVSKGCHYSGSCVKPFTCCEGNLCNSVIPTGPSVILLMVSSAIITIFL